MSGWGGSKVARLRAQLIALYGPVCWRCGRYIRGTVTVGHVVRREHGGSDDLHNLRPECGPCNFRDGAASTNAKRSRRAVKPSRAW